MRWNVVTDRGTVRNLQAIVALALLVMMAGSASAQPQIPDQVFDLGRIGLSRLALIYPPMLYRPIDPLSARPGGDVLGMGGAGLAASSGALAIGQNPAGLADLERLSFSFDGYVRSTSGAAAEFPDSMVIPQLATYHFSDYQTTLKGGFVPSFVAAGVPIWKSGERRVVAGFGWRHYAEVGRPEQIVSELVSGGAGASFPLVFSFDRSERGSLEAFSPSLAVRVSPSLSLAAVLNVLDGGVRATMDERLTIVGSPLRGTMRVNQKFKGISPEFGGRVNLGSRASAGFRLAPGYTQKVRGGTFYARSINAPGSPRFITTATLADYDLKTPSSFGAGVAVRPTPRLLLAVDVNRQAWSKAKVEYRKFSLPDANGNLVEQAPPDSIGLPLADVSTLHVGVEYRLFRTRWGEVPVRIGFHTAPQGFLNPDRRDLRADTLETDAGRVISVSSAGKYNGSQPKGTAFSFGFSLDTPGVRYDLGFEQLSYDARRWFFDVPYDPIANPLMDVVKVKQKISRIRLSATHTF